MKLRPMQQRLGEAFGKARKRYGLSQVKFAAQLQMHRTYYSAIERGEKNITLRLVEKICTKLSYRVSEMFADAEALR
jgi:transcriptional regulator with XRE-family HTH domain